MLLPAFGLAAVDGGFGLSVGLTAFFGFAFVPVLLALAHSQFAFDPPVAEVKTRGDERKSLLLRLRGELP